MIDRLKVLPRRPGEICRRKKKRIQVVLRIRNVSISEILGVDIVHADELAARAIADPLNSIHASDIRTGTTGMILDPLVDSNSLRRSLERQVL